MSSSALTSDGGVTKIKIVRRSKGTKKPNTGDKVHVHYVGRLLDTKEEFDTSKKFGEGYSDPFSFVIDAGKVIRGWDHAIKSMCVGEIAIFHVTSAYGYGEKGCPGRGMMPDILPGAVLEFEIELVDVVVDADEGEDPEAKRLRALRQERAKEKSRKDLEAKEKLKEAARRALKRKEASKKGKTSAVAASEGPLDAKAVKKMKPKELKALLKARGLSYQGSKKDLQARLLKSLV